MLSIVFAVITWIPALLGLGSVFRYAGDPALRRTVSGLMGLYLLAILGILVHFAVPVSPSVSLVLWSLGAALAWVRRGWLLEGLGRDELVGAGTALVTAVLLMQAPFRGYDAGLYYLQTVRWVTERRIEIGLANLQEQLAFNSAWLTMAGALEHPLAREGSAYFQLILPVVLVAGAAAAALGRFLRGDSAFSTMALATLLVPIAHAFDGLGSQSPDQALTVIVPFLLVLWTCAVETGRDPWSEAFPAAVLSTFAVMVKVSMAPLLLGGGLLLFLWRRQLPARWPARLALATGPALGLWLGRSLLLSGCLVYPAEATCVHQLRWTPDPAAVTQTARWIQSWARSSGQSPDEVLGSWGWLPGWLSRLGFRGDQVAIWALVAIGVVAMLLQARRLPRSFLMPLSLATATLTSWFLLAPDPRFVIGPLLVVGLFPLALAASRHGLGRPARTVMAGGVVLLGASMIWLSTVWTLALHRQWPIPLLSWPALPVVETVRVVSRTGYAANVPVEGDQCYAAAIPCTPRLDPELGRDWALVPRTELAVPPR